MKKQENVKKKIGISAERMKLQREPNGYLKRPSRTSCIPIQAESSFEFLFAKTVLK